MTWFARLRHQASVLRHEWAAQTAYERDELPAAVAHARALYALVPDHPWANYLLACHFLDEDRYANALPHLEQVSTAWPDDAWTFYALGFCHDWADHPRAALNAYQTVLRLAPDQLSVYKHLGRAYYKLGDYPAAEAALRRYCAEAEGDREAHDLLGYLCYKSGRLRASAAHYQQAHTLDPLHPKLDRNARLLYTRSARS